jgi:hypothetical protein
MARNWKVEHTFAVSRLPKHIELREGRPVSQGAAHRWRTKGVSGVVLEHFWLGGICMTSMEAYRDFGRLIAQARAARTAREAVAAAAPKATLPVRSRRGRVNLQRARDAMQMLRQKDPRHGHSGRGAKGYPPSTDDVKS